MSTIQVLKPKFHIDECLAQIRECLEKGWTGSGFKTAEFEQKWKEYTGHPYACYLNSNTSGLHLATNILKRRYGWQDGDEIITTPITFVSTNHAILYENLKPIFADVDEYLCLDPADVEKKITDAILRQPGVSQPHHLRTRRIGSCYAIEVHVRMDGNIPLREAHQAATDIEHRLKELFGNETHVGIHVEPEKETK